MNTRVLLSCLVFFAVAGLAVGGCAPQKVRLVPHTIESAVEEPPVADIIKITPEVAEKQLEVIEKEGPLTEMEFQYEQQPESPLAPPESVIKTEHWCCLVSLLLTSG
jgi:hypothetical protein